MTITEGMLGLSQSDIIFIFFPKEFLAEVSPYEGQRMNFGW
jgi:hypothetical protein